MKKNIGVIFGGNSVEHEISIISALQAMENMNKDNYNIIPVYLTKDNKFYTSMDFLKIDLFKDLEKIKKYKEKIFEKKGNKVVLVNQVKKLFDKEEQEIDVFFPIVHGTNVEDGKLQGYLSIFEIPIVGPSTLSGALGQEKSVTNDLLKAYNIPQADYVWIEQKDLEDVEILTNNLKYPLIIKPANLGSSIGITIAQDRSELKSKVLEAFSFDNVVVIENKLSNIRELNISAFKIEDEIKVSVIEEVYAQDTILSFEDKYISDGKSKSQGMASTSRKIPANITKKQEEEIQSLAKKVYKILRCQGVVRIDIIISEEKIYINEVNSIPGSLSYYLWEESGIKYKELLNKMIEEAIKTKYLKQNKNTNFRSNVLDKKSLKLSNKL